ncbi:MAG: phytanoyl-CoA dioxygenase family protein, partial [Flavitalea sp.]
MRQIFKSADKEKFFRKYGYIIFELLDQKAMEEISAFYEHEFIAKREVFSFAESLPYYISIFDADTIHKKKVDELISHYVKTGTEQEMINYEVFYSNFMIKFPGDGQIEAHQDFNFVDESIHTAFNLWCPLVDTNEENGGLFVIPGSHNVFRTQRGPNFPNALTKYNQMLKRYAQLVPLKRGQAIVFDHKLIHYSTPNHTSIVRLAIQSVLKPSETDAFHYLFDEQKNQVKALRIDKNFILNNDLWKNNTDSLPVDHEENLIPFPSEDDVIKKLIQLKVENLSAPTTQSPGRSIFKDDLLQQEFDDKGYAKLSILNPDEVLQLKDLFLQYSGGEVSNTDYGMYISLDNGELKERKDLINRITSIVAPRVRNHFIRCKQHLGSFLVKAPGPNSYTYPHQDWTFVSSSEFCSVTVWIALVDTDQLNGTLGFVNGSHKFFNGPVG